MENKLNLSVYQILKQQAHFKNTWGWNTQNNFVLKEQPASAPKLDVFI